MRTLLVIGYVWPEPNSSAAGSHMLSLIKHFRNNNWRVVFSTPSQPTEFNTDLESEGIECQSIEINDSGFDVFVKQLNPTAVLFDRFMMEEQFGWRVAESCPNALRILDTEDLQCLRGARHEAVKQNKPFSLDDLNSDLARREIASIFRCDLSLIISSYEMELLEQHFNLDPSLLIHLPFMLDPNSKPKKEVTYSERSHFVTIGNLRHAPNWDSVLWLQKIWPMIRKELPHVELHVYGAYTPPKATALNNPKAGFFIKDRAESVDQIMAEARVCLSPLRFGAGIKGKFIDAMLMKTPIVTTKIGAEGMTSGMLWPGIVANSDQGIVDAAVKLYSNKSFWQEKSGLSQPLLNEVYNGKDLSEKLTCRINLLLEMLDRHRINNFIGSMLNHHSLRSTKFMSKWIEEKNARLLDK
ncbi:MAG: glycosyltransferase family 4 protein [Kangiellaceae bacterium]|nr:glycosyltransferase family 4 protein [Kangiellaceae bacterium]